MEATNLNLLTRDGAVAVIFSPPREQEHYSELFDISSEGETEHELRKIVSEAATRWQRSVVQLSRAGGKWS